MLKTWLFESWTAQARVSRRGEREADDGGVGLSTDGGVAKPSARRRRGAGRHSQYLRDLTVSQGFQLPILNPECHPSFAHFDSLQGETQDLALELIDRLLTTQLDAGPERSRTLVTTPARSGRWRRPVRSRLSSLPNTSCPTLYCSFQPEHIKLTRFSQDRLEFDGYSRRILSTK